MRLVLGLVALLIILWTLSDISDACGRNITCRIQMETPQ